MKQLLRSQGKELEASKLLHKDMTNQQILELIMDAFLMDSETFAISLSMIHLEKRYRERKALEADFMVTGGRFIEMPGGVDPELAHY